MDEPKVEFVIYRVKFKPMVFKPKGWWWKRYLPGPLKRRVFRAGLKIRYTGKSLMTPHD